MKRLLFAVVALLFAACTTDVTEDVAVEAPETLTVSFEEDTRIQLMNGKTVWNEGDLVSVFYKSDANDCYKFTGITGERTSELLRVSKGEKSRSGDHIITVYPYSEDYIISLSAGTIEAHLPAEQTYVNESFGIGSSPMVSMSEYKQVVLKNVCGWLKVQFTGNGEVVDKITLRGNCGEQVAGDIMIVAEDASTILASAGMDIDDTEVGGTLVDEDSIITEVSLICPDGVTLSSEPTSFYIALPPQKFSNGLSIKVLCDDGTTISKSTQNEIVIERNVIQPMEVLPITKPKPANNEIWYTSTDGKIVTPYSTTAFGRANIVSYTYKDGQGIITFDAPVTEIGNSAFYSCRSLTSVTIPNSVTEIGNYAFYNCSSLTSVTIPNSVTEIGEWAFKFCSSLTSVTIPDSVTEIGSYAFDDCSSLTDVYYQGDLSSWCKIGFNSAAANPLYYGAKLYIDNKEITDITIPSDINSIKYTFSGCSSLTSVTIPDSVTEIGAAAFYKCSSLTSVTIPDSVTTIGGSAFRDCSSLTSVTIPDRVTTIGERAFQDCKSLTSVTIPDRVTTIEELAFHSCSSLTSITIPDSVTMIGWSAFSRCSSLTSITIPDSVTSIGNSAFSNCSSLTSVTIPDSVTKIEGNAFRDCSSLTSVTIPNSVTEIGGYAFYNCSSLKSVYLASTTPPTLGAKAFQYNENGEYKNLDCTIYVPSVALDKYKNAEYWSDYADYIEEYEFTE